MDLQTVTVILAILAFDIRAQFVDFDDDEVIVVAT